MTKYRTRIIFYIYGVDLYGTIYLCKNLRRYLATTYMANKIQFFSLISTFTHYNECIKLYMACISCIDTNTCNKIDHEAREDCSIKKTCFAPIRIPIISRRRPLKFMLLVKRLFRQKLPCVSHQHAPRKQLPGVNRQSQMAGNPFTS